MAILLLSISGLYFYQTWAIKVQKRPYSTLQALQSRLSARIEIIKGMQDTLAKLNQQRSVLEKLTKNLSYSWLLLRLSNMMNEYTWLKRLSIVKDNKAENRDSLIINGHSFRSEELGNFIDQLSGDSIFNNVVLKYARDTKLTELEPYMGEAARLIQFQIMFDVTGDRRQ